MLFKAQDVTDSGALMHIYPEVGGGDVCERTPEDRTESKEKQ